jgi:hypothetical protein
MIGKILELVHVMQIDISAASRKLYIYRLPEAASTICCVDCWFVCVLYCVVFNSVISVSTQDDNSRPVLLSGMCMCHEHSRILQYLFINTRIFLTRFSGQLINVHCAAARACAC